jgi:hypothetical protein
MKILGFAIIRWKRLQEIHAMNQELRKRMALMDEIHRTDQVIIRHLGGHADSQN